MKQVYGVLDPAKFDGRIVAAFVRRENAEAEVAAHGGDLGLHIVPLPLLDSDDKIAFVNDDYEGGDEG